MDERRILAGHITLLLLLTGGLVDSQFVALNLTADNLAMHQTEQDALYVLLPSHVYLNCDSSDRIVMNVNKERYDNCLLPTSQDRGVGHCENSPLYLLINSVPSSLVVNYQSGQYYYFVVYGGDFQTTYCDQGQKFIIYVTDVMPSSSSAALSSTAAPSSSLVTPSSSSPIMQSSPALEESIVAPITTSTTSFSKALHTTVLSRPVLPTTAEVKPTNVIVIDNKLKTSAYYIRPTNLNVIVDGITSGAVILTLPNILVCVICYLTVHLLLA